MKQETLVIEMITELSESGSFLKEKQYMQHGNTSVYDHSVLVATNSLRLSRFLKLNVEEKSLVRGALLHDYFLYDWHEKGDGSHRLHGLFHPGRSCKNAIRDYDVNDLEQEIIRKHMFPLTVLPPSRKEAWIVCIVDKYCALRETIHV